MNLSPITKGNLFSYREWVSSETFKLYSDAAGVHSGFAAVLGSKPNDLLCFHITIKELFPIVLALKILGHISNHKKLFFTDNHTVVEIINKNTSKDKDVMILVCRLVLASLKFNIYLCAKHIPGKHNVVATFFLVFFFEGGSPHSFVAEQNSRNSPSTSCETVKICFCKHHYLQGLLITKCLMSYRMKRLQVISTGISP